MNALMTQTSLSSPVTATPKEAMQRTIFTVEEFVKLPEFSFLTKSSLRHLLFNSRPRKSASGDEIGGNGLAASGAIIRVGRKVLIDAERFRGWLISQRETISP